MEAIDDVNCVAVSDATEMQRLERSIAYESACSLLESHSLSVGPEGEGWIDIGGVNRFAKEAVADAVQYLSLRGLLDCDPEHATWVRLRDETEATKVAGATLAQIDLAIRAYECAADMYEHARIEVERESARLLPFLLSSDAGRDPQAFLRLEGHLKFAQLTLGCRIEVGQQ
jgi:hypothetical protein